MNQLEGTKGGLAVLMNPLKRLPYWNKLTLRGIWEIKQNKPKYIARDLLLFGVPKEVTYAILLARGVFKWLAVRRKLIKIKNKWKEQITEIQEDTHKRRKTAGLRYLSYQKGYMAALAKCREDIRRLCHSARWQAPDYDEEAIQFLRDHNEPEEDQEA